MRHVSEHWNMLASHLRLQERAAYVRAKSILNLTRTILKLDVTAFGTKTLKASPLHDYNLGRLLQ